ncbi:MAG: hypothetical protein IK115_06330 [Lachnospiraceae bacterium]|nr:hypothetical protein [Lachnospiraceae bacterium]
MKKRTLSRLAGLFLAGSVLCAGCAGSGRTEEDPVRTEDVKEEDKEEPSPTPTLPVESDTDSPDKEDDGTALTEDGKAPEEELYEAFMEGREKALLPAGIHDGSYYSLHSALKDGEYYNLDEITEKLCDYMEGDGWNKRPDVGEPEFKYIDCGRDGHDELLIKLPLPVEGIEPFEVQLVLKATEEGLRICYAGDSWSRSDTSISYYGLISSGGSAGAASTAGDMSFLDADGEWHFWYSLETDTDFAIEQYYAFGIGDQYKILDFTGQDTSRLVIERFAFQPEFANRLHFYSFYRTDDAGNRLVDPADYEAGSPIMKIFTDNGFTVYSPDEIEELLAERAAEIGLPESVVGAD